MKSIKLASIALMAGLAYARVNHTRRFVSEVNCGSTCATGYDKSESLIVFDPSTANNDHSVDHHRVHDATRYSTQDRTFGGGELLPTLFCSGKDLKKKDIAGTCMDGNFLWYTSDDCSKQCKCDDAGKISCDIPSDCGPQKDVVTYCSSNPSFTCTCLTDPGDVHNAETQQHGIAEVFGAAAEARRRDVDVASVMVDSPDENVDNEPEQADDKGIPMIQPCFLDPNEPYCYHRPPTTLMTVALKSAS